MTKMKSRGIHIGKGGQMRERFSIGDVARKIDIPRHRIEYAMSNGSIQEPEIRVANKRAFNQIEIAEIAKYFGVHIQKGGDAKGEDT